MSQHCYFFVLSTLADVMTLEIRCRDIEVNVMTLSTRCRHIEYPMLQHLVHVVEMLWRCRYIGPLSFNLSCFYMMSQHRSCDVTKLNADVFNVYAISDVATLNADVSLLLRLCSNVVTFSYDVATLTWSSAFMCDVATNVMAMSRHWKSDVVTFS